MTLLYIYAKIIIRQIAKKGANMTTDHSFIERLFVSYPELRRLEGFQETLGNLINIEQRPTSYHFSQISWTILKKEHELRWILETFITELTRWHAKKLKRTPTITEMDKVFRNAGCCTLYHLISSIRLFEGTYQKLLIQARLTPNHKTRKNIRRDASA